MRLYPPAWVIGRRAIEDVEIAGYRIPKDAIVLVSPYVVQRDARWYEDPLRFDPDRWTSEARAARHRFAYFPFGGGSRQCIGEGFAWMEGILVVAAIARRWSFSLAPGPPIEPRALVTLRPGRGVQVVAHRRGP
jgi:cytochrome P450